MKILNKALQENKGNKRETRGQVLQSRIQPNMALNRSAVIMRFYFFQLSVPRPVSSTLGKTRRFGADITTMKEKVYLDSTVPSYYFDQRESLNAFIEVTSSSNQWSPRLDLRRKSLHHLNCLTRKMSHDSIRNIERKR
ncbi:MAG: hypothetical protein EPN21_04795 [Methylococcaceae bacterium]|nr:MAG: hypothetical protein EPN21_04795 [Methylococcaceae bacterium]